MLDIRTLSLITTIISSLFCAGMAAFGFAGKNLKPFKMFSLSNGMLAAGFLLLTLRSYIPNFLSILGANYLIILGFVFFHKSVRSLSHEDKPRKVISWIPLAVLFLTFPFFTWIRPNVNIRIILINAILVSETVQIFFLFLKRSRKQNFLENISTGIVFLIFGLFCLFRTVWTLTETTIGSFMQAGLVHGLAFILLTILVIQANFGGIWITLSEMSLNLQELVRLDPLTKVLNRRVMEEEILNEIDRSSRSGHTFSLIMSDIDFFKHLNDTYGHLAGDQVLVHFTEEVRKTMRSHDVLARYGGEEFLLILPYTRKKDAADVAERLRRTVQSTALDYEGNKISFTVSFGVATFNIDGTTRDDLLKSVDQALYRAKNKGRNRVETA